jgi:hypothetical protein
MIPTIKLAGYYVKLQQAKIMWGVSREKGRERMRSADLRSERQSVAQKWKWSGLEMGVSEKGHLSIFNKANQWVVNQKG